MSASKALDKPGEEHPRRAGWWSKVSVFLFAALVSLLLSEAATRFFFADLIVLFPRYHTDVSYGAYRIRRLLPNTQFWHTTIDGSWKFAINAQGFRASRDYMYEKPRDVVRIIALGDSQTQGFEVRQERTYSAVIERYLIRHGIKAEVLNTGVSGFSTAEALVFLENEGVKYRPDFVVLGFSANDFEDNVRSGLFRLEDDRLVPQGREYLPGIRLLNFHNRFKVLRWLSENSFFYSAILNRFWETAKQLLYERTAVKMRTEYTAAMGTIGDYDIRLGARLIERMYTFCRQRGIGLLILDTPQLDGEDFKSSVPLPVEKVMAANSDLFLHVDSVLGVYRGLTEIFVPNGHRHMSEFSHLVFGVSAAQAILSLMPGDSEKLRVRGSAP